MSTLTQPTSEPAPPRSDAEWLADLRAEGRGNELACQELRAVLLRGLRRALGGRTDDATLEDFAQDGLMRVLERLDGFRGDAQLTTWATVITLRVAFQELRRARWKDRSLDDFALDAWPADAVPSVERDLEKQALFVALQRTLEASLTPRQRLAVLAKLEGVPQVTLAERLGTNPNALYKLQHDARQRLRAGILAAGFSEADVGRLLDSGSGGPSR